MAALYIHIGTHKTGTTTIQHALQESSKKQGQQASWLYTNTPRCSPEFMLAKSFNDNLVAKWSSELNKLQKPAWQNKKVVMSYEGFSGTPNNGYENSFIVASMLRKATKQHNVKIILYLRRQDDFFESMYTQEIHQGSSLSFEQFMSHIDPSIALNYHRIIKDWQACFGRENIIVRSYHHASQQGILQDFGDIVGCTRLSCATKQRTNIGYSLNALSIARIANLHLDKPCKKKLRRALQKTMHKKQGEQYSYFTQEDRKALLARYNTSNQAIADLYFNGDIEALFPKPDETESNKQYSEMSHDDIAKLVLALISPPTSSFKLPRLIKFKLPRLVKKAFG